MRRSDREVTDKSEIIKIIKRCDVCRLALCRDNVPYIVPMNFGYEYADGKLTLFFHGAKEGMKLQIIGQNPAACFEMDCSRRLIAAGEACAYSMEYESVIGNGLISICGDKDEKIKALEHLMRQYSKDKDYHFPSAALDAVTAFKLTVDNFTGKRLVKKFS